MRKYAWCLVILFFIPVLFFLTPFGPRAEDQWSALSKAEGIETFKKVDPETGIIWYKAAAEVDAPLEALRELSFDVASFPQWQWHCRESRTIKGEEGRRGFIIYYVMDEGWPAVPRDYVAFLRAVSASKDELVCDLRAFKNSSEAMAPLNEAYARMTNLSLTWRMTRISKNRTRVEFIDMSEPVRGFPWFFVKRKPDDIPPKTLQCMRSFMGRTDKYHRLAGIPREQ